jgi:hypothetical protein
MIISKFESAKRQVIDAHAELCRLLSTTRGCKKARIEALHRRETANATGICPGCGGPLLNKPNLNGWCRACNSRLSRMMVYKSKIRRHEPVGIKATERFVEDYAAMKTLPYALRGDAGSDKVLEAATKYLDALIKEVALREHM